MGAKTWMLVYADSDARAALKAQPQLDREATHRFASALFRGQKLEFLADVDLSDTSPPGDDVHIGCFAGVSVVAAREFGAECPSKLPESFLAAGGGRTIWLHAMHSVVDWFAYAQWSNGKLLRSLSLAPDNGIIENIGQRLSFEEPFWSGKHPKFDDGNEHRAYPFPFHPLDLGEAALRELFGYQLEGWNASFLDPALVDAESIPLMRYKRPRSWWKFW
jgi:hypothetical protein